MHSVESDCVFAWSLADGSAGSIDPSTGVLTAGSNTGTFTDAVHVVSGDVSATASVRVIEGNVLNGSVTLQGSSRTAAARVVNVSVKLSPPGTANADLVSGVGALATFGSTTEDMGSAEVFFQATSVSLVTGTYDVTISSPHTLMNVKRNVAVEAGMTSLNFGTLLEGNSNNDSTINALDFSIMASSYLRSSGQTGYDSRSDYDYSGTVNAIDFSLMAANYMKTSPIEAV